MAATVAGFERERFRVLALDMDGTLAGTDGRVSERAIAALRRADAAGLAVVIVTGRALPSPLGVWRAARLSAPLITCGGALTVEPPGLEVLDCRVLPTSVVDAALATGRELGLLVSLWTPGDIWATGSGPLADLLAEINEMDVRLLDRPVADAAGGPILKVMLGAEPDRLDALEASVLDRLAGATASRSMPTFIEATAFDTSKEASLAVVLDRLGVEPSQVIAAGDGDNDLGMMRLAGYAVAPGDAMPRARAAADVVVGPHAADGIAEFLERVLDGRAPDGDAGSSHGS